MKNIFKNLFGDDLCAVGKKGNPQKFAAEFLRSEITLLSLPIPDSIDPSGMTQDELLALIEKAARQSSAQTEINLFAYPESDLLITPVFTSYKTAEAFVKLYVGEVQRIIPFEVISLNGSTIARSLPVDTMIVINPRSDSEYRLTKHDVVAIQQATA